MYLCRRIKRKRRLWQRWSQGNCQLAYNSLALSARKATYMLTRPTWYGNLLTQVIYTIIWAVLVVSVSLCFLILCNATLKARKNSLRGWRLWNWKKNGQSIPSSDLTWAVQVPLLPKSKTISILSFRNTKHYTASSLKRHLANPYASKLSLTQPIKRQVSKWWCWLTNTIPHCSIHGRHQSIKVALKFIVLYFPCSNSKEMYFALSL